MIRHDPPKSSATGERQQTFTLTYPKTQPQPINAELTGDDTCTARGIVVRAYAPVLVLCRELIAAGLDPDRAMEVYRGSTLALHVRSIGEAAGLEVNSHATAFIAFRPRRAALPVPKSHPVLSRSPLRPAERGAG